MTDAAITQSFCGTMPYLAPEVIRHDQYSTSVDLWQLGVFIYELIVG
jgi:serine/threonine protein kinase